MPQSRTARQATNHPRAVTLEESRKRLLGRLQTLYGSEVAAVTLPKLMDLVHRYRRDPQVEPLSEKDVILIAYPDHIQRDDMSPLAALDHFWGETLDGLISGVHVLPFYPTSGDKGFAVADYDEVDPYNGDWKDIQRLGKRGRVMFDCVLNHCSSKHKWFQSFLQGDPKYAAYFYTEDAIDASQAVRARATPLFTPFKKADGSEVKVWTTFGSEQPDLNYHSPDLLVDMLGIFARYIHHGAEVFRLDAAHFVWKEAGTPCMNLPQGHEVVKVIRDFIDAVDPSVIIITETNQPHAGNITYFGNGHDEAQMVYNFALPMLSLHNIKAEDAGLMSYWLSNLELPEGDVCMYNYTACHDCIATRGASEILTRGQWLSILERAKNVLGAKFVMRATPEGEVPYEIALTYFDAVNSPNGPLDKAVDRFIVTQAAMLAMKGVPGVYTGSIFGSKTWREDDPEDAARWQYRELGGEKYEVDQIRRANMERFKESYIKELISDPESRYGKVFNRYAELLRARRAEKAFHPFAPQKVLRMHPAVLALERTSLDGESKLVALHNFADAEIPVKLPPGNWEGLLTGTAKHTDYTLAPYEVAWLKLRMKTELRHPAGAQAPAHAAK